MRTVIDLSDARDAFVFDTSPSDDMEHNS